MSADGFAAVAERPASEALRVYVGRVLAVSEWMAGEWGGRPESYRLAAKDLLGTLGEPQPWEHHG